MDVETNQASITAPASGWATPFFSMWTGQAFSLLGSQLVQFSLVWWLTSTTGSATVLATSTLAALLPQIIISPFAGALVDRWNRRLVMMAADGGVALASLGLAYLFATGQAHTWHVYAAMLIRAAGGAFHFPAMQASTTMLVPDRHLARINGMNQSLNGAMNIAAPPLGAILLGFLPVQGILMVDVITAMLAISILFFIQIPQPVHAATPSGERPSMWQDMRAGLRYITAWTGMLIILIAAPVMNFLMVPAFSLIPLLVTRHFNGDALQLGMVYSAWGVGLVAGGLLLSAWGGFRSKIATGLVGAVGMGVAMLMVAIAPAHLYALAIVGFGIGGFMNSLCNGAIFSSVQSIVAPEMQGRVISIMMAAAAAMTPLSLLAAGPIADRLGLQLWYVIAGATCLAIGVGGFLVKPVMDLEKANLRG